MIEIIKESPIWSTSNLQGQELHDFAVKIGTCEKSSILDDFYVSITFNKSSTSFALPICGFYGLIIRTKYLIVMPISPMCAITLIRDIDMEDVDEKTVFYIEDVEVVKRYNLEAYFSQIKQKYGYIISPDKALLEELLHI